MGEGEPDLAVENARLREELRALRARFVPCDPLSSEQVYQSIFRLSPSIITVTRFEDGTYYDVNDEFCRVTGNSRERACSGSSLSLNLWDDPQDREEVKALLVEHGAYSNVEIAYHRADGAMLRVLQSAELVTIGESKFIIAITTDVTKRKQAEERLAWERERLSVTLQALSDGVIAVDARGHVEIMNRVAAELLGMDESSVIGRPIREVLRLLDGTTGACVDDPTSLLSGEGERGVPFVLVTAGGTRRVVVDGAPFATPVAMAGAVLVLRDVTLQLQIEEQLRKSSRLESLGVLAGGIAHDFNNVLMGIQSNVAFAREPDVAPASLGEALADVEKAVRNARELTQQLLTFSRGGSPIRTTASIQALLEEVTSFTLRGSNLRCALHIEEGLSAAEVDRSQISQVIENLIVNAQQAMPNGGSLHVSANNVVIDEESSVSIAPGRYVRLSFEDDGPGISKQDLPRIFDPFFSGKPRGTGLGLSIVHSVVKRHGGGVRVRSEVGKGTHFAVYLPASSEAPEPNPQVSSALRRGHERILVMDDEAMVRRSLQRLLTQLGYRVDATADGGDALDAYALAHRQGDPYAIVFLDLTVPGGTGGQETAKKLRELDPRARIVVSSGYSADAVMADPGAHGFDACITKPHLAEGLRSVLVTLLGAEGNPSLSVPRQPP